MISEGEVRIGSLVADRSDVLPLNGYGIVFRETYENEKKYYHIFWYGTGSEEILQTDWFYEVQLVLK